MMIKATSSTRESVRRHIANRLHALGIRPLSTDVPYLTAKAMRHSDPIAWFEATPLIVSAEVLAAGGTVEQADAAAWRARKAKR